MNYKYLLTDILEYIIISIEFIINTIIFVFNLIMDNKILFIIITIIIWLIFKITFIWELILMFLMYSIFISIWFRIINYFLSDKEYYENYQLFVFWIFIVSLIAILFWNPILKLPFETMFSSFFSILFYWIINSLIFFLFTNEKSDRKEVIAKNMRIKADWRDYRAKWWKFSFKDYKKNN